MRLVKKKTEKKNKINQSVDCANDSCKNGVSQPILIFSCWVIHFIEKKVPRLYCFAFSHTLNLNLNRISITLNHKTIKHTDLNILNSCEYSSVVYKFK